MSKEYTHLDHFLSTLQGGLEAVFTEPALVTNYPADKLATGELTESQRRISAGQMRINHVGEVCAQALYQGQALTARSEEVREAMSKAAREEQDHLSWCFQRLQELDSRPSLLNPIWYLGALVIGVGAGIAGDKWSLGFVEETERQVVDHLTDQLNVLPKSDYRSRAIVHQMCDDEADHAKAANAAGAAALPTPIPALMKTAAGIMKLIASRL